jgi:ubiquinone/menaquinone biosynthesis C-methylase UbiE
MEVEPAALTVHAPIFTEDQTKLDIKGDFILRDNFHTNMKKLFNLKNFKPTKVLDVGCSTGLSTLKLCDSFPLAEVIGVDLSPYMLAVAKYSMETKPSQLAAQSRVSYLHALGEDTGLARGDLDLVTMS